VGADVEVAANGWVSGSEIFGRVVKEVLTEILRFMLNVGRRLSTFSEHIEIRGKGYKGQE
jgi:hypothetical protein